MNITPQRITALRKIMSRFKGSDSKAQCTRLAQALIALGHINTYECSRYLDIYHPPARKLELIKAGWRIASGTCKVKTENGGIHTVAKYIYRAMPKVRQGGRSK